MSAWQPNQVIAATHTHATIEEQLEVVFSAGSVLRLYIRRGNWSLQTDEF
jgi:hypothetical protein